jgi:flagellin
MALNIATDKAFLLASKSSDRNTVTLNQSMERLTSGLRINSASNDAAGVAVATRINSDVQGMRMAIRNATDGQSMINTAERAMVEITNILQRMRELAIQVADGTNSPTDRDMIQLEIDQLTMEVDRIAQSTQWAGQSIFYGARGANELATSHTEAYITNFQIGSTPNDGDNITVNFYAITSEALDIEGSGTVPTIATTYATGGSGAVAINPTDGKVTLSGAFAADDKITMTIIGKAIQTTLTDTDIIDTGAIAVNGTSAVSAGEYYITSMGTTDFTTLNSGISVSVTSPIADSYDGANGLGSIITVAANTTSLTGTDRVKAIKTDADDAAAAVGNQFKVVNSEPVLFSSALSATLVADAVTTAVADSTTYLVTEGQFRYNGNDYSAGQSFAAITNNGATATATASGAIMLTAVTASTISTGGSLTNGQIGNSASGGHIVALVTGQSYLVSSGTMTYNSVDYSAGSAFTAISGGGTAAAKGGALSILTTGSDFNAGEVIEKAAGVYIGIGSKLVE